MTSYSVVSRAIGVTWSRVTGDWLVAMAPTITKPIIIIICSSPALSLTSWARPTVPPAPGTLKTSTLWSITPLWSTCWTSRAVVSQPPPGAAGAMICTVSVG